VNVFRLKREGIDSHDQGRDVGVTALGAVASSLLCPMCEASLASNGDLLECSSGHSLRVLKRESMRCSSILHLDPGGEIGRLVLKLPLLSEELIDALDGTNEEKLHVQVEHERGVMSSLAQMGFSAGPYRVPELVPGAVAGRSILMRHVDGRSLQEELYGRRAWLDPHRVGAEFELAGRWLGRFSAATVSEVVPFDPRDITGRTRRFMCDLERYGHAPGEVSQLRRLVDRLAEAARGAAMARCLVHGDFRTNHVLVTSRAATVLDFEQAEHGWAHQDAAFFLASIDGFSARNPLRRWSPGGRLVTKRFLSGYVEEAPAGWPEAGRLLRVAAMIRALRSNYRGRLARQMPLLFHSAILPHYRRWFERAAQGA
jgi:hypothetical protein